MSRIEELGKQYGLALALLVSCALWMLPTPATMTIVQHKLLVIFAGMVILWITTCVSFAASIIIMVPVLYLWVGNAAGAMKNGRLIHDASFALAGFGTASLWLLVAGFILATAMVETGLAKRLALIMLRRFGKTPLGAVLAPMFAGLFLAPLTPAATARTAAMLPIVEGVAQAYNAEKGSSNFGKGLFLANTYAQSITCGAFLTATVPNPVSIGMMVAAMGGEPTSQTSWAFWALAALPTSILVLVGTALVVLWMFPPEKKELPGGSRYIEDELRKMGPLSAGERKALFFFALALLLWSTDMWHKLNSTMLAFVVSGLILLPKIGLLSWKEAQKGIPWELFIFFGGVITLSGILTKTQAIAWVIHALVTALGLEGVGMLPLMIGLMGFTIFSHVIWSTTTAMAGVMIPIYIGFAKAFGFPVVAFVLPQAVLMAYALFLPFNTMPNIIMYGAGYYTVAEQLKSSTVVALMAWGLWALTAVVWFPIIGLR